MSEVLLVEPADSKRAAYADIELGPSGYPVPERSFRGGPAIKRSYTAFEAATAVAGLPVPIERTKTGR